MPRVEPLLARLRRRRGRSRRPAPASRRISTRARRAGAGSPGKRARARSAATRGDTAPAQAPPQLHRRCAACVSRGRPSRRTFAPPRWIASTGGSRFVCRDPRPRVPAVFFIELNGSVEALATQLALDHSSASSSRRHTPRSIPSSRAGAGRRPTGWLISVPTSAPVEQLELLDVRRCMSTQGASAHIMYKWRGQPLSVYVLNSVPKSDRTSSGSSRRLGQEAVIWSDAGRTYAVVGAGSRRTISNTSRTTLQRRRPDERETVRLRTQSSRITSMNKRWILALTAAVGVGLLAVPLFVRRSAPPPAAARGDRRRRAAVARRRSASPECKAEQPGRISTSR